MRNKNPLSLPVLVAVFLFVGSPGAHAAMRICNLTTESLNVAKGVYYTSFRKLDSLGNFLPMYESRGWYPVEPRTCKAVEDSGRRRVWLIGVSVSGVTWEAENGKRLSREFCIHETDQFYFDEGEFGDIHVSRETCERNGGVLRRLHQFLGDAENYDIYFEPAAKPPLVKPPVAGGGSLPPSGSPGTRPLWETDADPDPTSSRAPSQKTPSTFSAEKPRSASPSAPRKVVRP